MLELTTLTAGFCTHPERMVVAQGAWKPVQFPSLCFLIKHPERGFIMYDTGYSKHFFTATNPFPERIYRWVTPVTLPCQQSAREQLHGLGVAPQDINYIVLSHFHGDHVGGLLDFPDSKIIALEEPIYKNRWAMTAQGFLPALLPKDYGKRSLSPKKTIHHRILTPYFGEVFDLFGDQSLLGVDLSGHTPGQMGLFLETSSGPVLLIADACWNHRTYQELLLPHPVAMLITHNARQYKQKIHSIHNFWRSNPDVRIIASHSHKNTKTL